MPKKDAKTRKWLKAESYFLKKKFKQNKICDSNGDKDVEPITHTKDKL